MKRRHSQTNKDNTTEKSSQAIVAAVRLLVDWMVERANLLKTNDTMMDDPAQDTAPVSEQSNREVSH